MRSVAIYAVAFALLLAVLSGCSERAYERVPARTLIESPILLDGKYVVSNTLVEHVSHDEWVTYTPIFCPDGGKNGGVYLCGMVPWLHRSDTYKIHASMDASSVSTSWTRWDATAIDGTFKADVYAHVHQEWRWQFFWWHSDDKKIHVDFEKMVRT
jgi:hypothetical protein